MTGVLILIKRRNVDLETHRGRVLCEDTRRARDSHQLGERPGELSADSPRKL